MENCRQAGYPTMEAIRASISLWESFFPLSIAGAAAVAAGAGAGAEVWA